MSTETFRAYLQKIFRLIFRILTYVEVQGLDHVPEKGGCILATNHLSIVDPVLVLALIDRSDATALVAKKHQKNPFIRWLITAAGGIWLNRDETDTRALRAACAHLQGGGILGISPEGTRSHTHALIPPKTGVAFLADKAGVPLIPVAITGTEITFSELISLHRPHITVRFGEKFSLPTVMRQDRDIILQRNTDEIMSRIAALLPTAYQGVYANHPRVRELIEET
jgi:1-acyl-sn-glycerol-3-phosphate acyltransferase